jgi:bifunctional polynucleotide phosphatase/kinase
MSNLENFFKRKEAPQNGGGASGVSARASAGGSHKSAKISSDTDARANEGTEGIGGAPRWSALHGSFLIRVDPRSKPNPKIAAFDLDDTIQKTKSGRPGYAVTDISDFVFWSDEVLPTIRKIHGEGRGHRIVLFSNQGGVKGALDGKRASVVRARVDALAKHLAVPLDFFCGTQSGPAKDPHGYRKPGIGAWAYFAKHLNGGLEIDTKASYYVGDAAGRLSDHSDSDLVFARNVGIEFFTPEAFFVRSKPGNAAAAESAPPAAPPRDEKKRKPDDAAIVVDDEDDDDLNRKETP